MRDPFEEPFCNPEDLGLAIPDSDHATSVCLPTWDHVIGYEEGDPAVIETFECGYPRFVAHPFVAELFDAALSEFGKKNEAALVFPTLAAAWRCADFVKRHTGSSCRLESYGWGNLTVVLFDESAYPAAWKCWQHGGEIVSSRLAESALTDSPLPEEVALEGAEAIQVIKDRLASFHKGVGVEDVFLFSSGMAAIFAVYRILTARNPEAPTLQIEFPYLDSFKVQEKFGDAGVVDFSSTESGGLEELEAWLAEGKKTAGIFTEIPSNPLLRTADLAGIAPLLREHGIPLAVDDTVATCVNVDGFRFADVITSSLTKLFSGAGDVMAGAVAVNPKSEFAEKLREELAYEESASPLFERDAITLERNSLHFEERVRATNENAEELVSWLINHEAIEKVSFPQSEFPERYDALKKAGGGYGALFSILLKGGEAAARRFYDSLAISKGPSLGTNFSLACPYTLLAHYNELEWAAERGARRDLIRIWVGLEEPEELKQRFEDALGSL